MKLKKIALVLAMFGLSNTYAFAQLANEHTQVKPVETKSAKVDKGYRLIATSSVTSTISNLSEVQQ